MGMLDRMRAAFRGSSKRKGTGLELSRWASAPPRREVPALLAAYAEMPWLGTIVDTVGDAFADVTWRAFTRQDPATRKSLVDVSLRRAGGDVRRERLKSLVETGGAVELPDHPLLRLLADPNDYMTGRDFAKLFCLHYDLTGEFFAVVEELAGVPVGLWPVPPDCVLALPDLSKPKSERTYTVAAGGRTFMLPAASVIYVKRLNPADPLGRGIGIAYSLGDEVDTDEHAARFTKNAFFNNMLPGAVIAIEGFNESQAGPARAFKESLAREYGGPANAGRVMITSGRTTFARLDTPFRDMQLVDLRRFLMDFVRMVYRVPPEIVGDVTSSNKATSYAAREHLAEQATKPRAEVFLASMQKHLAPRFEDDVILSYDSPVPADREHRLRVMGTLPSAFTFDEWRVEAGFKPHPERQGFAELLPGQKPNEPGETPTPVEGSSAEAHAEATKDG